MLEECLDEICTFANVQIGPFLLLDFGNFVSQYLRLETRTAANGEPRMERISLHAEMKSSVQHETKPRANG
jgi:hypothetical protein